MKPAKFILQIMTPDTAPEVLAAFTSTAPPLIPQRGDIIDTAPWGVDEFGGEILRAVQVTHRIEQSGSLTHTVSVQTALATERVDRVFALAQQPPSTIARIRERVTEIVDEAPELRRKGVSAIEQQVPRIKAIVSERVGPLAKKTIENDEAMIQTFRMLHEFLPTTLRLMLKKDKFVEFCLRNRERLIDRPEQDEPCTVA